jgi:hypothetical protein
VASELEVDGVGGQALAAETLGDLVGEGGADGPEREREETRRRERKGLGFRV